MEIESQTDTELHQRCKIEISPTWNYTLGTIFKNWTDFEL